MSRLFTFLVLLTLLFGLSACSGDNGLLPDVEGDPTVAATVALDGGDFVTTATFARTGDGLVPVAFELRGRDIRYSDADGTLLVDLTVTNRTERSFPEPVTIDFTRILPDGVVLWNPPLGPLGYVFGFANDDALWTPGETSLPLTVAFVADEGVAVGFAAEIRVGLSPQGGSISGTVFEDLDGDGVRGADEAGIPGMALSIEHDDFEFLVRAVTDSLGGYTAAGLPAGAYTVTLLPQPLVAVTGDPVLHVLLTEGPDGVTRFTGADFGAVYAPVSFLAIPASADATVRADISGRENDNHGADPFLAVGTSRDGSGRNDRIRGYMRFDLPPADDAFTVAYLELTIAAFRDGSRQTYELVLNPVLPTAGRTPWQEGNGSEVTPLPAGVVWVDAADGIAWIGAGDGGDANNQTQPEFATEGVFPAMTLVQSEHAPGDIIRFDVTELVRAWSNGFVANEGLVLRDVGDGSTFRQLWFGARDGLERDYTDTRVQPGPRLVLHYDR